MPPPILFDAVIFDLDGTLVATDRFWVAAARAGARRAFEELGIQREIPGAEAWLSMVGIPLVKGFEIVFPDLDLASRKVLMQRCVEEEERAVRAGQAALLPGVVEALGALRERGVRVAVASNCSSGYLTRMLGELELDRWVETARCLDSEGVHSKADMLRDLLSTFETRSAVMVGDRASDSEAAHANALPHVHLAQGLAPPGEVIEREAEIRDLFELVPLLERRAAVLSGILERFGGARSSSLRTLGVTGHSAAGKSLLARDFARLAIAAGRPAVVVDFDGYLLPRASGAAGDESALAHVEAAFDVEALVEGVLAPRRRGEVVHVGRERLPVAPDALLIVEGLFLLHPRIRLALDRAVFVEVDDATSLKRIAARLADPEALIRARRTYLPLQRAFDQAFDPRSRADVVLPGANALLLEAPSGAAAGGGTPSGG